MPNPTALVSVPAERWGAVEVRYIDTAHGKGAFAARSVNAGAAVLEERPLVSLQTNRRDVAACAKCLRALGDVRLQVCVLTDVDWECMICVGIGRLV